MPTFNIDLNHKPDRFGKYRLFLRVTQDQKLARYALEYSVAKSDFNLNPRNNQYIRKSNADFEEINQYLSDRINDAQRAGQKLMEKNPNSSAKDIIAVIRGTLYTDFFEFSDQLLSEIKESNFGNYKKYRTIIAKFKKFVDKVSLSFDSLTPALFDQYRNHLTAENNPTTIDSNFRTLKAILNKAKQRGMYNDGSMVVHTKITKIRPERTRLDYREVQIMQAYEFEMGKPIWHTRNGFVFSILCGGIRIGDLLLMKWSSIINDRLEYQMQKTGRKVSFGLSENAKAILAFYDHPDKQPDDFIFPFMPARYWDLEMEDRFKLISSKSVLYNKYLTSISNQLYVDKHISSHTARHTFADLARQGNANLYSISKALGHSSLNVTEKYIKGFDQDAVDEVINIVNTGITPKKEKVKKKKQPKKPVKSK